MNKRQEEPEYLKYYKKTRRYKGLHQKFDVLDQKVINDREHHVIINSDRTNNKYQIVISRKMSCTCKDFQNRNKPCKHIYYVIAKVYDYDLKNISSQTKCLRLYELNQILNHVLK